MTTDTDPTDTDPAGPAYPSFPAGDPRGREDGLGWVTRAVFPDPRVRLTVGSGPVPGRVVARYAVVPSVARARFLLPLVSRRVTAASVLAYNALRPRKLRAARAVLGALARLGLLRAAPLPTLTVSVPSDVDPAEVLLTSHVAGLINEAGPGDRAELHAAMGVRPPDPNHKPTLQVFDAAGRPRGYAKIGWNDATRALVRAEIVALRELAGSPTGGLAGMVVPRLLAASEWRGLAIAVVEPLPARIRGVDPGKAPAVAAMLALARSAPGGGDTGPERVAFGDSPFAVRLLRDAGASGFSEAVWVVTALWERDRETVLEFGGWHGDWVPWNLGRDRGRLVVWDWEHRGHGVPVGFDLVHQGFQSALTLRGLDVAGAVEAAEEVLGRYGAAFGLGAAERRLVVDAYLVELWLRTWRLAEGGAGWNGALHPALLAVLGRRLAP
jgi:hypothetical protein